MQSVLIPVPEANPLVDRFRLEGDWSRRVGVPAHITLAGPFPLSTELPMGRLAAVARSAVGLRFSLGEVGRVGDSTCLLVADEAPLAALRTELLDALGQEPQADGAWPFDLTISRDDSAATEAVTQEKLGARLPLDCEVESLLVVALHGDRLDLIAVGGSD